MSVLEQRLRQLIQAAPASSDALWQLLIEGLEWPVPHGLDLQDVEIEWSPEELHLDPDKVAHLTGIRQVPPFTKQQQVGIFLLDFEGGRLPVGAIRRVVERLVRKERARPGAGSHPLWALHDLLFFCLSHEERRTLHVVGFRERDGKRLLRVLTWTQDLTPNRLDLLMARGVPELRWADHGPTLIETGDLTGFHGYREGLRSASALSSRMADVAQDVRDEVLALYEVETAEGPMRQLYADVHDHLLSDLTPQRFADVYAQTMVYGLLTARIAHPEQFQAGASITALSFDNPFLDAIYARFRTQAGGVIDVDELGLGELAEELAATDIDDLLADFGSAERRADPVVYFYEDFLAKYDPQQRRDLGAFYTPTPVVRYIVRSVDDALKRVLDLPDGVADATSWGDYISAHPDVNLPPGCDSDTPVVSMVDPATGTGTFLVEWLRAVRERAGEPGLEHALRSSTALEISLASYAVSHLKVSLDLPERLRHDMRLPIFLGDTLGAPRPHFLDDMQSPVSAEGRLADQVKYERFHNVVIGNPPYDRVESGPTGGWVTAEQESGRTLFDDVLSPATAHTNFAHIASLYNLYVYFWRWALWKAFECNEGPAVISMITASSWLTGPGFLGLRQLARELADEIWITDLGGENKGARKDENVFDIETPVVVVTLVRGNRSDRSTPGVARYRRLRGTRVEKLNALDGAEPGPADGWSDVPSGWFDPLVPRSGGDTWWAYPALVDLLPWQQPGCKFGRTWPIAPSQELLERRWSALLSTSDAAHRAAAFFTGSSGRNTLTKVAGLPRLVDLPVGAPHRTIRRYGYRSFDSQYAFDDPRLAKTESPALWAALCERQVFMVTKTTFKLGAGPAAVATRWVPDLDFFRGSYGGKDVIPLYRDGAGTPNADPTILAALSERMRLVERDAADVTVEELFAYVYGLLAGTDYSERFHDELETPGPRIPLTADPTLFREMSTHGWELLALQTSGNLPDGTQAEVPSRARWLAPVTRLPQDGQDVSYDEGRTELRVADGVLAGVSPAVWAFEVSGLQVIKKWLGYRCAKPAGRAASSTSPLDHIRPEAWHPDWTGELVDLVDVLTATLELQPRGVEILDRILEEDLVAADELPEPASAYREPPKAGSGGDLTLDGM